jgi:hypothetical protein
LAPEMQRNGLRVGCMCLPFHEFRSSDTTDSLTAGLALRLVSGKSLVPAPPPRMTATTVLEFLASSAWSSDCTTHPKRSPRELSSWAHG